MSSARTGGKSAGTRSPKLSILPGNRDPHRQGASEPLLRLRLALGEHGYMAGGLSTAAGDDIPRNELAGWRVVATLSVVAACLTVGGLAFDLDVIITHQLTGGHRAWNIALLFLLGLGLYLGIATLRTASPRIANLRSPIDSN